ncbi:M1 family aminopeptidase [Chitinophagaceae bacterium MMS25-I14]
MKYSFPSLLLGAAIFASCGPSKKTVTKNVVMDTVTVSAKNNPLDIYRSAAPRLWEITHTRVALDFNWKQQTAAGREWLQLHPYGYAQDTLTLDAKGMKIDSVCVVNGNILQQANFHYANNLLHIKLDRSYRAEDKLQLYIRYTAMPYDDSAQGGSKAITDDRGLYFINTDYSVPHKPAQIWTQGETESNSHWMVTLDKPNQRSAFQIELTVPDSMQTLSNGAMVQSTRNNNMRTDTWKIEEPIQVYAAMFAIGKFSIVKESWKGKEVNYYVESEYAPYAKLIFQNTPEMMSHFSDITGILYPWNKYDQVVVRDYVSGAMENTTASLFGEFVNQDDREIADRNYEDVVSHELFHQWFGDYVTAESWSNITVNESFANYSEYLWRKYKYGTPWADELALEDLNKYLSSAKYNDPALVRFHYADREEVFDRISYEKGGRVLHYLHTMIGDSMFYKAMHIYLQKNALHAAEAANWRLAVEEATGQDWNWFFDQWYFRAGHPSLDIEYNYNDTAKQLTVTVTQKASEGGKTYDLPLKAMVIYGNEKSVLDWRLKEKKEVFTYPYHNGVRPVLVPDVEHVLPGDITEHKLPYQWLVQYSNANDFISRRRALHETYKTDDSSTIALFGAALMDQMPSIRRYALELLSVTKFSKWEERWKSQVQEMAVHDNNNNVRAAAFTVLKEWKITAAKDEMIKAVGDKSYAVAGAALAGVNKTDKDTAYVLAKNALAQKPRAELYRQALTIMSEKGNASDISYFENEASYVLGSKKFYFASGLSSWLKEVKDESAFSKGLNILTQLNLNESMKSYRSGLAYYTFGLEKSLKEKAKTDKSLEARIAQVKQQEDRITKAEKDPDNIKMLKKMQAGDDE